MTKKIKKKQYTKKSMKVKIGFPECVRIEMVQSNDLRNYEIFMGLSSIFSTAGAGFWVAFATLTFSRVLLGVSIVFSLFAFLFIGLAFHHRWKMNGTKITKTISVEDFK